MKTQRIGNALRGGAALVTAAVLTAALLFTACPQAAGSGTPSRYVQVKNFDELQERYMEAIFSTTEVNYIEITDVIPAADFIPKGALPSAISKKLEEYSGIKIALKLNYPAGLTDMHNCFQNCTNLVSLDSLPAGVTNISGCFMDCTNLVSLDSLPAGVTDINALFAGCTNLTAVPAIPEGVTNMNSCFHGCTELASVSDIPSSVKLMATCFENCTSLTGVKLKCDYNPETPEHSLHPAFKDAFNGCTALTAKSIKVPAAQFTAYKNNAATMGTTEEKFAAE